MVGRLDIAQEGNWTWSNNGDQFWEGDFNGRRRTDSIPTGACNLIALAALKMAPPSAWATGPSLFMILGAVGEWNDLDIDSALIYVVEFDGVSDLKSPLINPSAMQSTRVSGWFEAGQCLANPLNG